MRAARRAICQGTVFGQGKIWPPEMAEGRKKSIPFRVSPMLATLVSRPFHKPDWTYEEKYDGIRILAYKEGDRVSLISRNQKDRTNGFPRIVAAIGRLEADTLLLDGEIAVFDARGVSRFQLLQQGKGEASYVVFDCLYRNGEDLRRMPLAKRRGALENSVRPSAALRLSARLAEDGRKAFQLAKKKGLEGLVAKHLSSPYLAGRSEEWLKVKATREEEFVIGGFTAPGGSRTHFGALLLGIHERGKLAYVGKVGTGFDQDALASLYRRFRPLIRKRSPFATPVEERNATFLAPELVAQASFTEWTKEGKLRHPVFLGLRDDKNAGGVTRPET